MYVNESVIVPFLMQVQDKYWQASSIITISSFSSSSHQYLKNQRLLQTEKKLNLYLLDLSLRYSPPITKILSLIVLCVKMEVSQILERKYKIFLLKMILINRA